MKISCKFLTVALLSSVIFSCHKGNKINPKAQLTDCPVNANCTYSFINKANINLPGKLVSGDVRVFYYSSVNTNLCNANTQLYFKTSLSNNDFIINSSQIAAGQALYNVICPCCDFIGLQPIGGEIKGQQINTQKWLVNATVLLGNSQNKIIDTIKFNQYFIAKALDN